MIDLTPIKIGSELEALLVSTLPLQSSTLNDIQRLVQEQHWRGYDVSKKRLISDSHIKHLIKEPYDKVIRCLIPASQRFILSFLFKSNLFWDVRFHFENDYLVQIIVTRIEQNPL